MAAWIKVVAVLLGLGGFAAVVATYGLSQKPAPQAVAVAPAAPAPAAEPPKPSTPEAKAPGPAPAPAQVAKAAPEPPAKALPQPEAPAALEPPTFDIVRVTPTGDLVVAGRAAAGSQVELLRNGGVHDKAKADPAGQFAMVPPALQPGAHDLSLVMVLPDGRREPSRQTVAVSVPSDVTGEVVVALAAPDKPTQILSQAPAQATSNAVVPVAPGERAKAAIETVEVEESGRFFVSGRSAPAATVRLYLNDTFLAPATASPEGRWSFAINRGFEPGAYKIRIDDVDAKGTVISRAEVPFDYAPRVASRQPNGKGAQVATAANGSVAVRANPPAGAQVASTQPTVPGSDVVVDEIRTTTVTRGDSLWRISKRIYGKGQRFTVIYEANSKQIRDPRLIYPGQLFVVPGEKTN
jgi:nucleoid-associated protein YgaU